MGVYSGIELANADLVIDAVYEGVLRANGTYANPLNRLVHVSSRALSIPQQRTRRRLSFDFQPCRTGLAG